jgi:aspartate/methionine/tyrosine aminotransferase
MKLEVILKTGFPSVSEAVREAVARHDRATLVFPSGLPEQRERIALGYRQRHGAEVAPRTVLVNVGTRSLFRNIFQLPASAGDEVLVPRPYYLLYLAHIEAGDRPPAVKSSTKEIHNYLLATEGMGFLVGTSNAVNCLRGIFTRTSGSCRPEAEIRCYGIAAI